MRHFSYICDSVRFEDLYTHYGWGNYVKSAAAIFTSRRRFVPGKAFHTGGPFVIDHGMYIESCLMCIIGGTPPGHSEQDPMPAFRHVINFLDEGDDPECDEYCAEIDRLSILSCTVATAPIDNRGRL